MSRKREDNTDCHRFQLTYDLEIADVFVVFLHFCFAELMIFRRKDVEGCEKTPYTVHDLLYINFTRHQ